MDVIKLSLILPVYNVSSYIERCLDSICSQMDENIEVIIVDDESPDDSIDKVIKYCDKYPNISILHQENRGLGGARNTGLRNAKGEYIWFIDSDDEIAKDVIPFILNQIQGEEIIIFDYDMLDKNGNVFYSTYCSSSFLHISGPSAEKYFILGQAWRSIYKRDFLINNNLFFREHFLHEDGEFNMRAMCYAYNVSYVQKSIYRYYTSNNGSIMNNINIKNILDLFSYIDTEQQMIKKCPYLSIEQRNLLINYVLLSLAIIYKSVPLLNNKEVIQFRNMLKKRRGQILSILKQGNLNSYELLKSYVQLFLPYKVVYRLIYYKCLVNMSK